MFSLIVIMRNELIEGIHGEFLKDQICNNMTGKEE